jgi:hypothetical protein
LAAPGSDRRMVVKSAAKLKTLAGQTITVADPLAFSGCRPVAQAPGGHAEESDDPLPARILAKVNGHSPDPHRNGSTNGNGTTLTVKLPKHPVTMWRGRLSVALDALEAEAYLSRAPVERRSPMETTNVQLPTGDRLQIPTGAETLRMKSYLIMCRNSSRDYAEFAELVDSMETHTAAVVLAGMDRYYCGRQPRNKWVATQLVRRLADPQPSDEHDTRMSGPQAEVEWAKVRERCLSVAVAMLEEAR